MKGQSWKRVEQELERSGHWPRDEVILQVDCRSIRYNHSIHCYHCIALFIILPINTKFTIIKHNKTDVRFIS